MTGYLLFLRRNWPLLGFGFATVFWGNFGQSFFIAWFGTAIQQQLGLSASVYGAAYSLATLAAASAVIWMGGLLDRITLQRYALMVSAGLCIAAFTLSLAQGLVSLFLGFFLLRLFGQSLLPHTGMTTMARYFTAARGKAISIAMSGVPAGEVVLPLLAVWLIGLFGWQGTFAIIGSATVLVLVPGMLWLLGRSQQLAPTVRGGDTAQKAPADIEEGVGRRAVLGDYRFWLALPALISNPFMITGIFIHQGFLVASKDWTMSWLALCFTLYGVVHWLSSLVSGVLVDRYHAARLLPLLQLPLFAALAVAAFMPGWWSAPVMMTLLGVAAGSGPPVTGSLWPGIYGTRRLGAIRSMTMAIMVASTSLSPVLFGYLIDRGISVAQLFGYSALYVACAFVLVGFSYPRDRTRRTAS